MNALPTTIYKGKRYFIDMRLREFRSVEPPIEFVPFDSDLGREIDESWDDGQTQSDIESLEKGEAVIINCPQCGRDTFIGYAQGYTSDDRPYPVGRCCCCHMELATLDDEDDIELMMEFRNLYWDKWVKFCLEQRFQPVVQTTHNPFQGLPDG